MNADAHLQWIPAGLDGPHRVDDLQSGTNRAPGVVLVRARISEVHQQAISEILGHVAVVTANDGAAE